MALLRFDPFRNLERWPDQTWSQVTRGRSTPLAFDAYRRDDDVVLQFDLPGVDPQSIEVTVERNALTVSAERPSQRREGDRSIVVERPVGRFVRQLRLSEGLDTEKMAAGYEAGVLTLTVPVADEIRPRKVEIKVGSGTDSTGARSTESESQVNAA